MKFMQKGEKITSRNNMMSIQKEHSTTIPGTGKSRGIENSRRPLPLAPRYILIRWLTRGLAALSCLVLLACISEELRASLFQSKLLAPIAAKITFRIARGPSSKPIQAPAGPYDQRMGYARLPQFSERLRDRSFAIHAQAEVSDEMREMIEKGSFPIFKEKTVAGLDIRDRAGQTIYSFSSPRRIFRSYEDIPPLIIDMLLFIEDRKLLDTSAPYMNPAVNWTRLAKAFTEKAREIVSPGAPVSGGSTLATQMEKFRHSLDGRTRSMQDKKGQVLSASLRSYQEGAQTLPARRRIVLDYINSVPLAAYPGYGEVTGLGDGLWVWYGADLNQVTAALKNNSASKGASLDEKALRVKQVLSLLMAHKKPSYFLNSGQKELENRCTAFLKLMAKENVISNELAEAAQNVPLALRDTPIAPPATAAVDRKAVNPVRVELNALLGNDRLYDLDRFDLLAKSSLDLPAQKAVSEMLAKLKDPGFLAEQGLRQKRLLDTGDPAKVVYALTLYEKTANGNELRIQTDSTDQSLNFNEGVMLDLGSSAKLRTLVTYLEIVSELYQRYRTFDISELRRIAPVPQDAIQRWAVAYLINNPEAPLEAMLRAALERKYSASPYEQFFTGGGLHTFQNFNKEDDHRIITVREGLLHSVNLVFIRLMRDVVQYQIHQKIGPVAVNEILKDDDQRNELLARFAQYEGITFLRKYYGQYKNLSAEEVVATLFQSIHPTPRRLAAAYRYIYPERSREDFAQFIKDSLPGTSLTQAAIANMYSSNAPEKYSIQDVGYVVGLHPLELWLAGYLRHHPGAEWREIKEQSKSICADAYAWLFRTGSRDAQVRSIHVILEKDAFQAIHARWKRLGYRFDSLVPSYATSIGSSADSPAALADLMGILLSDGIRRPSHLLEEIRMGANTPYETQFRLQAAAGERVLAPEIPQVVKEALYDVVRVGTAARLNHAFIRKDGTEIAVGGKTGTGDHRFKTFDSNGNLLSAKAMHRTATFTFILGDRFFGDISAYVLGPDSADYGFTSSLPVAVLKLLSPILVNLESKGFEEDNYTLLSSNI
ncbi:MAG: transglycosylase domain-containing protein [Desulfobacteraceae bacterium]|nr:transglycosylase domain-containing protein [Desulfobacteraceae bacterium]